MMNIKEAFEKIEKRFLEAGVDSPAFEVSVLMEDLLNLPRNPEITVPETVLKPEEKEKLFSAAEKRAKGYRKQNKKRRNGYSDRYAQAAFQGRGF